MTAQPFAGPSRRSVYTGRTTIWWVVILTCAWVVLLVLNSGVVGEATSWGLFGVVLLVAAVGALAEILTGSSVRVTAGPNGVTVHWGLVGWPRSNYRIEQIERAEMVDVPWWRVAYGFWWTPRRTSCTVRRGPTLRLKLRSGRTVLVTAPDPAAAVAALDLGSRD